MEKGNKCANFIRIVLFGVFAVLAIITGWLIYAYFNYQIPSKDHHLTPVSQGLHGFNYQTPSKDHHSTPVPQELHGFNYQTPSKDHHSTPVPQEKDKFNYQTTSKDHHSTPVPQEIEEFSYQTHSKDHHLKPVLQEKDEFNYQTPSKDHHSTPVPQEIVKFNYQTHSTDHHSTSVPQELHGFNNQNPSKDHHSTPVPQEKDEFNHQTPSKEHNSTPVPQEIVEFNYQTHSKDHHTTSVPQELHGFNNQNPSKDHHSTPVPQEKDEFNYKTPSKDHHLTPVPQEVHGFNYQTPSKDHHSISVPQEIDEFNYQTPSKNHHLTPVPQELHRFNDQTPSKNHHLTPVPQEIDEFTRQLYKLELKQNPYLVKVNFQGKTKTRSKDDVASQPLIQVNDTALSLPILKTTLLLRRLYDNYELFTNLNEDITSQEREEEMDFLKAILDTAIMKKTMEFLKSKNVVTNNTDSHLELLKTLWFYPYSRKPGGKVLSSTGFEHVFLGEIRKKTVLGLHNWMYFSDQERLGHMDYKGYIEKKSLAEGYQYIVTYRSQFFNKNKVYNGIFVGTSPELEMSLYTVCFVLRAGKPCPVQLGDLKFKIVTWPSVQDGKKTIGSAYPSLK